MTIAFKPRSAKANVASFRYRVLAPIAALQARGHMAELFDAERTDAYEAVVFSKAIKAEDQALAAHLKASGRRAYLDLCDNQLFNPNRLPEYDEVAANLRAMAAVVDAVICSTPVLANQMRALGAPVVVVHDTYEQATVTVRPPGPQANFLWFGRHASPNAEGGMADLARIAEPLARAFAGRPFTLTICSDSKGAYEALKARLPVPTRYVAWTPESAAAELSACDAVLLPLSDNPFVAAKSHNRLTLALSAGVPVVADSIDAYREFAPFTWLDDWDAGLASVLTDPQGARRRAAGAPAYLRRWWSGEAVAAEWEAALGLTPGAAAHASTSGGVRSAPASLAAWLAEDGRVQRPWLVAGDAAPETQAAAAMREGFLTLGLGRLALRAPVDLALVRDVEMFSEGGEALERYAGMVAVAADLRQGGVECGRPLAGWAADMPSLHRLIELGRIIVLAPEPLGLPLADLDDEEAAVRLLAGAGVRMARWLGVRTPKPPGLESARSLGARRGGGIPAVRRAGLSYGPYGYPVPARVFVGSDDEQRLGVRVLEWSLQQHSTMDVVVETLDPSHIPVPKDPKNRSKTGFSFCRFDIPRLCGWSGRGVYVDADMQVFGDIADLWTLPFDEADVLYALTPPAHGRIPQTSVMLLNCAALPWKVEQIIAGLDDKAYGYKDLMQRLCIAPPERVKPLIPYWWNSLERHEPGRTCLIHYTDMPTQPWVTDRNPNGALWYAALADALAEGFIAEAEIAEAIALGHVSPRLPEWIGRPAARGTDRQAAQWVAPYHRFTKAATGIEGAVVATAEGRLVGWAFDPAAPEAAVTLEVHAGEHLLATFEAADLVPLLERHGKGDGRHGFDVALPAGAGAARLSVRPVGGFDLPGSPLTPARTLEGAAS